jgi:hypothetical protein
MEGDYDVLNESKDILRLLEEAGERLCPGTIARAKMAEREVRIELYKAARLSLDQLHRPVNI